MKELCVWAVREGKSYLMQKHYQELEVKDETLEACYLDTNTDPPSSFIFCKKEVELITPSE